MDICRGVALKRAFGFAASSFFPLLSLRRRPLSIAVVPIDASQKVQVPGRWDLSYKILGAGKCATQGCSKISL
jgi:hypothetical protein